MPTGPTSRNNALAVSVVSSSNILNDLGILCWSDRPVGTYGHRRAVSMMVKHRVDAVPAEAYSGECDRPGGNDGVILTGIDNSAFRRARVHNVRVMRHARLD
jgi:hypothetical protein